MCVCVCMCACVHAFYKNKVEVADLWLTSLKCVRVHAHFLKNKVEVAVL